MTRDALISAHPLNNKSERYSQNLECYSIMRSGRTVHRDYPNIPPAICIFNYLSNQKFGRLGGTFSVHTCIRNC